MDALPDKYGLKAVPCNQEEIAANKLRVVFLLQGPSDNTTAGVSSGQDNRLSADCRFHCLVCHVYLPICM